MANSWQVAEARRHFADVIDAASHGEPQFIARRDGSEVVVVSKSYFNATRPNLRTALSPILSVAAGTCSTRR